MITIQNIKNKCLEDLGTSIELKRNEVIKNVLDGITVDMQTNPKRGEPDIYVHIGINKYIKMDK